jgi:hypothetical protein
LKHPVERLANITFLVWIKVDPWQLQAQLGHKSLGTTDRYATYAPSYLSEMSAAIQSFYEAVAGQLLARAPSEPIMVAAPEVPDRVAESYGKRGGARTLEPSTP